MKEELDYEQDIIIDDSALDLEWLDQPALFLKYSRNLAQCNQRLDEYKQNLDIVKAEADSNIRKNPDKYKIDKITEAVVTNLILQDEDYQEAYKAYLNAKYEVDIATGAVRAFDQRKSALENLVKLHGQSYFAGPKLPRDLSAERSKKNADKEEREEKTKSVHAKMKMRRNK